MPKRGRIDKSVLAHGTTPVTKAPEYLDWLRTLACVACYAQPVEAAHLRLRNGKGTGAGMSQKNDRYCLPLCRACHQEQHRIGERTFWLDEDPHAMADRLWKHWSGE